MRQLNRTIVRDSDSLCAWLVEMTDEVNELRDVTTALRAKRANELAKIKAKEAKDAAILAEVEAEKQELAAAEKLVADAEAKVKAEAEAAAKAKTAAEAEAERLEAAKKLIKETKNEE